jgi:hypothetical protein
MKKVIESMSLISAFVLLTIAGILAAIGNLLTKVAISFLDDVKDKA